MSASDRSSLHGQSESLKMEQRRLLERMPSGDRVPEHVLRAAVSWVPPDGELCRRYGPAFIIGYSLAAAIEAGVVRVVEPELRMPSLAASEYPQGGAGPYQPGSDPAPNSRKAE